MLAIVSTPVNELTWLALNCRLSVAFCPGLRVTGAVIPESVNKDPATEIDEIVTAAVPVEVSVTDCLAVWPTITLPKLIVVALTPSVGVPAFNCNAKVFVELAALAVRVTAWLELNEATVAENPTLLAFAGTVTVAGSVTAPALLERLTLSPPLPAAALKVTVQASVPAAVMVALLQLREFNPGALTVPVPLRLTIADGPVEELLEIASCPVAAPTIEGSNCRLNVAAWPGFKVTGNEAPDIVKPEPVNAAALTVTGPLPVDVKVTDFFEAVPTAMLPKLTLVALTLRVGVAAFNCTATTDELPFTDAVKFAACAALTADTVALKVAVVALAGTVTVAGTLTATLSLLRATLCPLLPAAPLNVTVQASVPEPVMDTLLHENPLNVIVGDAADFLPMPCSLTAAVGLVVELLVMVTCPVDVASEFGLK